MKYNSLEDFVIQQLELLNLERDAEIAENRRLQEIISAKQGATLRPITRW